MQEVIAWAKLNSALKERLVRAAAHCLSPHSLESTIFYGWWGTDGSQCCPRTLRWWGWKQSLKKFFKKCHWAGDCFYGYTVTIPAWLILKLANQSNGIEALAAYYLYLSIHFFFHVSLLNCMGSQVVWWIFHQSSHFSRLDLTSYPSSGLISWQVGF